MEKKYLLSTIFTILFLNLLIAQNKSGFIFFSGDSLNGYDTEKNYKDAVNYSLVHHLNKTELARYLYIRQNEFIVAKYHMNNTTKIKVIDPTAYRMLTSACNNVDFENGDYTGWTGFIGYNSASGKPITVTGNGVQTLGTNSSESSCSYHTLVTAGGGTDPFGAFSVIDPNGGTYAARLGGENINSVLINSSCTNGGPSSQSPGEVLEQTFTVTKSNSLFTYKYAVILNDGGHNQGEQPYFKIEVLDNAGNPIPCLQYYEEAIKGKLPPGFISSPYTNTSDNSQVYYIPWSANALNLSAYVGKVITVRFTAAGCIYGQHFGYGYVDCSCSPVQITFSSPTACQGSSIQMTAPPGADAYQWSKIPAGPGIAGTSNTQTITVNQSGAYEVKVTTGACSYVIDTSFNFSPYPVLTPSSTNITCNGNKNGSASVSVSAAQPPFIYSWSTNPVQTGSAINGLSPGTYTVSVTSPSGCSTSGTAIITEPSALASSQSHTDVSCNGGSNGSVAVSVSGGTQPYSFTWSPVSPGSGASVNGLAAGTYTCQIHDANNCNSIQIVQVGQPGLLQQNISVHAVSCFGASNGTALTAVSGGTAPYTYQWTPSGGTTAQTGGLSAGSYTSVVHDTHNCLSTQTVTIIQPSSLTENLSGTMVSCNGGTDGTAQVTAAGGTPPYLFSWSPNASASTNISGLSSNTYTCTMHDANGCVASKTLLISQSAALVLSLNGSAVSCNGGSNGTAGATVRGGTPFYSYQWLPSGGTAALANNLPANTYTCVVHDSKGCTINHTFTLTQPPALILNLSGTATSCNGSSNGSITASPGGGTGPYTYRWLPSGGSGSVASGLAAGTYTCILTDTHNCQVQQSFVITQPSMLALSLTSTDVSCNGGNDGSIGANPLGGTSPYKYSWSPTGLNLASIKNLQANTYTCVLTDAQGCTISKSVSVNQPSALSASLVTGSVSCFGGSNGSAAVTVKGGTLPYQYYWPNSSTSSSVSGLPAGKDSCMIKDAHGCSLVLRGIISQPSALNAVATTSPATCHDKNGTASVQASGGKRPYSYSWSPVGGTGNTAQHLGSGNYLCVLTDSNGCSTTVQAIIPNNGAMPIAQLSSSGPTTFCAGKQVVLTAGGGTKYYWSNGDTAAQITASSAGTYWVHVSNFCGTDSAHVTVTLLPYPNPVITGNSRLCKGDSVLLTASGGNTYSWNTGENGPSIYVKGPGPYVVTASNNCGSTIASASLIVNSITAYFTTNDTAGSVPFDVEFRNNSKPRGVSWAWIFGDNNTSTYENPVHVYSQTGTYTATLTVSDSNGCKDSYSRIFGAKEEPSWILIPNVFTPNGDGSNDNFHISSSGLESLQGQLFDRWGVMMAELHAPNDFWDGHTQGGEPANAGTYYYMIKAAGLDGKRYDVQGFFVLLR
jgi:gliding motility-associated-like protein